MSARQWERGRSPRQWWIIALSIVLGFALALLFFGCDTSGGQDRPAREAAISAAVPAMDSGGIESVAGAGAAVRLVVAPTGNEVRYRVREQLARVNLPNDAIGKTGAVTGGIAFDSTGRVISAASRFVINVSTLQSDRDRRDNYVRNRTLKTSQYPTVILQPTAVRGLTWPLPPAGTDTFKLQGNLTLKGVTRPTTWRATARFDKGSTTGTAATAFTFADFGLSQPSVPVVLSVADTIRLEYDFHLTPVSQSAAR